jgi:hypothetical protein
LDPTEQVFQSKARIECIWHHESPFFTCINADALVSSTGRYVHAALFRLQVIEMSISPEAAAANKRRASFSFRMSFSRSVVEAPPQPILMDTLYSVDIGTSDAERQQFEVMTLLGSTTVPSELTTVKICGESLVFGGKDGFVAVGTIGNHQYEGGGKWKKVLFLVPVCFKQSTSVIRNMQPNILSTIQAPPELATSNLGRIRCHSPSSTITCLASAPEYQLFVCGDDQGCISLWRLKTESKKKKTDAAASAAGKSAGRRQSEWSEDELLAGAKLVRLMRQYCNYSRITETMEVHLKYALCMCVLMCPYMCVLTCTNLGMFRVCSRAGRCSGDARRVHPVAAVHVYPGHLAGEHQ